MPEHILLLNLTRLGDMLQSQPLLEDLHDSGHKISLLCLENFFPAVSLMRHVDHCYTLPGAKLLADSQTRWQEAAGRLLGLAEEIGQKSQPSKIINLTPTLSARLLSKLLAPSPEDVLGFGVDGEGFGVNRGVWSSFLSGAAGRRVNTPFNIVDMFRRIGAGLCPPQIVQRAGLFRLQQPSGQACAMAQTMLAQVKKVKGAKNTESVRGYVGFQLGASEARRQWPVQHFVALGQRLWKSAGFCPVLLGTEPERSLAEAYMAHATSPFIDAVGKTGIPELAALLRQMRLLVTNDTGTMHLAAGLGVPCLAFFLATAQPWDTAPYLVDCCCLEPALACHPCAYGGACQHGQACLMHISAQTVGDIVLQRLESGIWSAGPKACKQARVWRTDVDEQGCAVLRCLSGHEIEDRSRWLVQQRLIWRQILDDLDGRPGPSLEMEEPLPDLSRTFRDEVLSVLNSAVQMLGLLTEQGRLTGRSAMAGQLFLRNCDRLQQMLDSCGPLASLSHFWRELVQDRGGNMQDALRLIEILAGHLARWAQAQIK